MTCSPFNVHTGTLKKPNGDFFLNDSTESVLKKFGRGQQSRLGVGLTLSRDVNASNLNARQASAHSPTDKSIATRKSIVRIELSINLPMDTLCIER